MTHESQGRIKLLRAGWLVSQHPQYGAGALWISGDAPICLIKLRCLEEKYRKRLGICITTLGTTCIRHTNLNQVTSLMLAHQDLVEI